MIIQAKQSDLQTVFAIVQTTISEIYPHYYPTGAVQFFQEHHCVSHIASDISDKTVYLFLHDGIAVGTLTINGNEINRLFVLPEFQGRGFGTQLMAFAEQMIGQQYEAAELSSSFSAQEMYQKLGYVPFDYRKIPCDNGDWLCYYQMRKILKKIQPK